MMQTLAVPSLLLLALAGCAVPPQTGIVRLGDGVMQARTMEDAERFCRTTGEPIRQLEAPATAPDVLFRCD